MTVSTLMSEDTSSPSGSETKCESEAALSQCDPQISVIREVGGRPVAADAKPDAGLARGR